MSLDHGTLNLPLARREGIDTLFGVNRRQHDAQQRAEAKAASLSRAALLAEAKGLIEMVSDARMAELGKPHGLTARQCRKQWHSIAWRAPATVIKVMRQELGVAA
jgi:hypothetical protein